MSRFGSSRARIGGLMIALAMVMAVSFVARPERLHVPMGVALSAAGAFAMGGVMATLRPDSRALDALATLVMLCFATASGWVALFSADGCRSSLSIPFVRWQGTAGCRAGFGISTALLLLMALWAGRRAIRGRVAEHAGFPGR